MHTSLRRHDVALFLGGASVLLALTSCATGPGTRVPSAAGTPEATVVAYPLPDLGPSPAPAALDAQGMETLRLEEQNRQWESVTITYPDASRPADPFLHYRDSANFAELIDCFTEAGLRVDIGTNAAGTERTGIGVSPEDESQAVSAYQCWAAYPSTPIAPMTTEQVDYLYSYLTEYLVPCYEANDITIPDAPSRADFVRQWPNQGWFPDSGGALLSDEDQEKLDDACIRPV